MAHIQFERKAAALHKKTDDLLGLLFDSFTAAECDSLNALAATCQAAIVSIIKQKVNRAYLLLTELAGLAGIRTE